MAKHNVLVIGERCSDVFVYGISTRKSPEGNGPVFIPVETITNEGMAANTAANLASMGLSVSIISNADNITKTRYINLQTNELYLRVDTNDKSHHIDMTTDFNFWQYDAIVISDYCKGFLRKEDNEYISKQHPLVFLDTKKHLGDWCKNVTFIKLNRDEAHFNHDAILEYKWLEDKIITTLDSKGASYKGKIMKVERVENADVSGAGDTFLAGFVARYLDSHDIEESIKWANYCAGEVVKKKGVSVFGK